MLSKKFYKMVYLFTVLFIYLSIYTIVEGQVFKKDPKIDEKPSVQNTNNQNNLFSKIILSPNISAWIPLGGGDSKIFGLGLKYGINLILKTSDKLLLELGYSYSSLAVKDDYIKDFIGGAMDIKKSNGGNVNQFFGGIRLLFPAMVEGSILPYLRIGLSNYKRGNITASYSNNNFKGDITIISKKSGMNIYGGLGQMILFNNKIGIDYQINCNFLLLGNIKPIWIEPVMAVNIFLWVLK